MLKSGWNKHEINTNLPLARARRLKYDMHDSSLIMIEHPSWEEQCFMIQQDSKGQALWGAPEPQPEQWPYAPKRKKKQKKVWRKVESSASSSSPGRADEW